MNYTGTIHFTTSDMDPRVVLPPDYTFQPSDAGMVTFPGGVTLITVGAQTLTATDTLSGISGSATVTVTSGPGPDRSGGDALLGLRSGAAAPATAGTAVGSGSRPAADAPARLWAAATDAASPSGAAPAARVELLDQVWSDAADSLLTSPWLEDLALHWGR